MFFERQTEHPSLIHPQTAIYSHHALSNAGDKHIQTIDASLSPGKEQKDAPIISLY